MSAYMTSALLFGCSEADGDVEHAMTTAAVAALSEIPDELADRDRRLSFRWSVDAADLHDSVPAPLLAEVQGSTGLPLLSIDELERRDSSVAILSFLAPPGEIDDSLMVYMDWVSLRGGDSGAVWGETTRYLFDCTPRPCRLVRVTSDGYWP